MRIKDTKSASLSQEEDFSPSALHQSRHIIRRGSEVSHWAMPPVRGGQHQGHLSATFRCYFGSC